MSEPKIVMPPCGIESVDYYVTEFARKSINCEESPEPNNCGDLECDCCALHSMENLKRWLKNG